MTNQLPLNVISPKALEKQLKIVESRMTVLQAEMTELEKIKNACLVLMGTPEEAPSADMAGVAARSKKKKATAEDDTTESNDTPVDAFSAAEDESQDESVSTH
jgi:hypothetical protein